MWFIIELCFKVVKLWKRLKCLKKKDSLGQVLVLIVILFYKVKQKRTVKKREFIIVANAQRFFTNLFIPHFFFLKKWVVHNINLPMNVENVIFLLCTF